MSTISGEVGTVGILNVGHGDTKLSFDPNNPQEAIRAARIVRDMIRRGYALLVQDGDTYRRATDFDETKHEYIIADFDPTQGVADELDTEGAAAATQPGRASRSKRVPAASARAVAVGPRAGG